MSADTLKVIRSRLVGARLEVTLECPQDVNRASIEAATIVDTFGRWVTFDTVTPESDDGASIFVIEGTASVTDPEADPPSFLLTVSGYSTWFAPASPRMVAPGAEPSKPPPGAPSIDYLGRDYIHFLAMMHSRVSQIVEEDSAWALDHLADPMTTILETFAYAGDHLSFRQDAAGTESYLTTARRRLSLRRHARLRDYEVNDGCNARTALVFAVQADGLLPAGLQVVTPQPGHTEVILPTPAALVASTAVFETMHAQLVSPRLNDLGPALAQGDAYTLPVGSIELTLQDASLGLVPGQLIVLRQLAAPEGMASPFGAQVLRLLKVEEVERPGGVVVTVLAWHPEDALTAPLTIPPANTEGSVSLFGNVALADHGQTLPAPLSPNEVPSAGAYAPTVLVEDVVSASPLPHIASAFDGTQDLVTASLMVESARASLNPDPRTATPCIAMSSERPGMTGVTDDWNARRDLLSTAATGRSFAVELEQGFGGADRRLNLRFGDGGLGYAPAPETVFTATARTGGGQSGRVRANSLLQVIGPAPLVDWVTNPLPALPSPGEESEAIRLFATTGFRTNLRGIAPGDWERLGLADPLVAEVHASPGPHPCTVGLVTLETAPDGVTFPVAKARLMRYAVLGAPPSIEPCTDVAIDVALVVYCDSGANIGAARERLLQRLGSGSLPDGSPAFFNPVNWPLGRQVLLDELVDAIEADSSVSFVVADPRFDPRVVFAPVTGGDETATNVARGRIEIGPHQRVRVGNDVFDSASGSVRLYVVAAS